MRNNDTLRSREDIRQSLQEALRSENGEAFTNAMNEMMECVANDVRGDYEEMLRQYQETNDSSVMNARGVRQLTSVETKYYQRLSEAMRAVDVKQALNNADLVLPETVLDAVFDELQTRHPLLDRISFTATRGAIKMMMSENGYQKAQWGELCSDIVKEILAGFKTVDTTLLKLTAFMPVCRAMLDLGPVWLDSFVRQVLYEALANGLEYGIIKGDGNGSPIGMIRQVGDGVAVVGGVYPEKAAIVVEDLSPATVGNLISFMAVDPAGKPRDVRDLILVVSPQDYFQKVMPATTIMAPDGTYRNDVLPYPITIIQSAAIDNGEAVLGIGYKYFAAAGMDKAGRIEYSDHYQFLEDNRVYTIRLYANGFPMDNNAFLHLDISNLRPPVYKVEQVTAPAASTNALLNDLRIGNLTLSPAFDKTGTTVAYTATTTNAQNVVTAVPADAGATVEVLFTPQGGTEEEIPNGTAAVWNTGANTIKVNVTAVDGSTTKTYTVTVTKS